MGTEAVEETSAPVNLGEAEIVKEEDTGKTELEKEDEAMGKVESVKEDKGMGKVESEKEDEDMGKVETGKEGEDEGKVEPEKEDGDMGKVEPEKKDEDMGRAETETKDLDMVEAETEKKDEDVGKAETEKKDEKMGEVEIEKKHEDTGEAEIEEEDYGDNRKSEKEEDDENQKKPETEKKDDGKQEAEAEREESTGNEKTEIENEDTGDTEIEEKNDDKGKNEVEEKYDGTKESEVEEDKDTEKTEIGETDEDTKKANLERKEENGVKPMEEDSEGDEENPADHDLEEQNDSNKADKGEEVINEGKEVEAQVTIEGKRSRKPSNKGQSKEESREPISPAGIERPVRERKSVERLVASIEKEPPREFLIPKGHGTALKDIPNVAHKLSRKKNEETCKMLHSILFGRRGKAAQVKINLSQFSGFAWHENEEKQRLKLKEKLDKLVKEKLLEFCDVFDIPVLKVTAKKEDIVTKLLDFLAAPHPANDDLVGEKEKSGNTKKRSRIGKGSTPETGLTSEKHSSKKQKSTDGTPKIAVKERESDSESDDEFGKSEPDGKFRKGEDNTGKSVPNLSEDEASEHSESKEHNNESGEEPEVGTRSLKPCTTKTSAKTYVKSNLKKMTSEKKGTPVISPKKQSTTKRTRDEFEKMGDEEMNKDGSEDEMAEHSESTDRGSDSGDESEEEKQVSPVNKKSKKVPAARKDTPHTSPKKTPTLPPSKVNNSSDKSPAVFSRKKKTQDTSSKKSVTTSNSKENETKEKSGDKGVIAKKVESGPTEKELRKAICEILTEVDLNKATFLDILQHLGERFTADLGPKKSAIKVMVKEELIKLNDADDEDDDSDSEKDEKPEPAPRKATSSKKGKSPSVKAPPPPPPPPAKSPSVKTPPVRRASFTGDPENRCRRSDGKKWRCFNEAVPDTKYCEHHLNRGKKR